MKSLSFQVRSHFRQGTTYMQYYEVENVSIISLHSFKIKILLAYNIAKQAYFGDVKVFSYLMYIQEQY